MEETTRSLATRGLTETLGALRRQTRITRQALAEYLGVSPNTYLNWERGKSPVPAWAAFALAALYGVTLDQIYGLAPIDVHDDYLNVTTAPVIGPRGKSAQWRSTRESSENALSCADRAGILIEGHSLLTPRLRYPYERE